VWFGRYARRQTERQTDTHTHTHTDAIITILQDGCKTSCKYKQWRSAGKEFHAVGPATDMNYQSNVYAYVVQRITYCHDATQNAVDRYRTDLTQVCQIIRVVPLKTRHNKYDKYVRLRDGRLSTYADPTSTRRAISQTAHISSLAWLLRQCNSTVMFTCGWAWPVRWPTRLILGFWGSKVLQNVRLPALDADEPP